MEDIDSTTCTHNRVDSPVPSEDSCATILHTPFKAPELATIPAKFEEWARQVKLDSTIYEVVPSSALFKPIQDLQLESKTFPRWAMHASDLGYPCLRRTALFYNEWRDRLCDKLVVRGFHRHDNVDEHMRMPNDIDRALKFLYRLKKGPEIYRSDGELRLPAVPSGRLDAATTPADSLDLICIWDFEPLVSSPEFQEAVAAVYQLGNTSPPYLMLVHCVTSYATEGCVENHMKMCMVSALHQKKVLGMRHQFVFGIFEFDRDFHQVVAGIWQDDEMKLYKVGEYSFSHPALLCEFYFVLMGIWRMGDVYQDEIVAAGPALLKSVQANPPTNEWAQDPRVTDQDTVIRLPCNMPETNTPPEFAHKLAALEKWNTIDKINAFREGTRECERSRPRRRAL